MQGVETCNMPFATASWFSSQQKAVARAYRQLARTGHGTSPCPQGAASTSPLCAERDMPTLSDRCIGGSDTHLSNAFAKRLAGVLRGANKNEPNCAVLISYP